MTREPARARSRDVLDVAGLVPSYVVFAVLKHLIPLPRLASWAWHDPRRDRSGEGARRIVDAVVRLSRRVPLADTDCLQRSLVLYRELSRAGAEPILVLGFAKEAAGVRGHAWVEIGEGGTSVIPEDVSSFVRTMSFGPRGRLSAGEPLARRA